MTTPGSRDGRGEGYDGMRVEIVPDDNALADPRVPQYILDSLTQHNVLTSKAGDTLYVRAGLWEKMKHRFPMRSQ